MNGTETDLLRQILLKVQALSITANTAIEYGAGATTAKTQRVAIATDANSVVFASPQAVTGTFWQATQPVSGSVSVSNFTDNGLTDTQLRASAVPVSVASIPTHPVTNAGTFAVQVTSAPSTPVTGTFWQATQPVTIATLPALATGTNTIGAISNTAFTANAGTNLNTSALALESGGNLAGLNTKVPSGLTVTSTRLLTDSSGVTQPVSAASLPLPTGASTSALQIAGNTSLSNLDTRTAKATAAPTTSVASSATSTTLLALNTNRKYASFRNDSTSVAYVAKSATATTSSVYLLQPQGNLYFDDYTGVVTAIWVTANGFMQIEEGT